jgi:hypothetical protein
MQLITYKNSEISTIATEFSEDAEKSKAVRTKIRIDRKGKLTREYGMLATFYISSSMIFKT